MSDDLNNKIKQLTDLLSQESMPDNLKSLFSLLTSSMGKNETSQKTEEIPALKEPREEAQNKGEFDTTEMVRKIKTVMDRMNTKNDPRVNLLSAIRPYMNTNRQKTLDNCIKVLQVSSLAKLMDETEK
jgi:hypothetical protein